MSETEPGEDAAWAAVVARWTEEEAHRDYLGRLWDLEGLAEAGRRYKAALDASPQDPVARRWRDEVIRRATAVALSQLPRTRPPRPGRQLARRALIAAAMVAVAAMVAWMLLRLPRAGSV
jgi:hypothetical protein